MTAPGHCPHCDAGIFVGRGNKVKLRTSILVFHKSTGEVEANCPQCKGAIMLPIVADLGQPLTKSSKHFGVRVDMSKKSPS